jgi:hypothetical protein
MSEPKTNEAGPTKAGPEFDTNRREGIEMPATNGAAQVHDIAQHRGAASGGAP